MPTGNPKSSLDQRKRPLFIPVDDCDRLALSLSLFSVFIYLSSAAPEITGQKVEMNGP